MSQINNRSYITFLIAAAVVFINADLNLLSPNLSIIADEFGFSQREKENKLGGTISIFFFMVGAPSAIIFGYLSDKFRRVYLLSFIMILSETACLLTYFSVTYTQLLVCRIFTGVGVGGSVPIIFSLLGDLYSSKSRIYVSVARPIFVHIYPLSLLGLHNTLDCSRA
jgi:MFS family permease